MKTLFAILLALSLPALANAQVRDRHAGLNQATQTGDSPLAEEDRQARQVFSSQCMEVVGVAPLCGCLAAELPPGLSFDQYVVVLSRTREENGYDGLGRSAKRAYDAVPAARDACAATVGAVS